MNINDYDVVLSVVPSIYEEDSRMIGSIRPQDASFHGPSGYRIDPSIWNFNSFGNSLQQSLSDIGRGFEVEVTDFKKCIVVRSTYHNYVTGRSASKTFLIIFDNPKGDGIVMNTSAKWRSINGYSQAASYIKSSVQSLKNLTSSTN